MQPVPLSVSNLFRSRFNSASRCPVHPLMSGVTCWPPCPLIISIIQERVIGGSDYAGPDNPRGWCVCKEMPRRRLVRCKILDYVVTYDDRWILWWPALLRFAGYERLLRENFGFLMDVGRWFFARLCRPGCPQFAYIQHVKCFDLFEICVLS